MPAPNFDLYFVTDRREARGRDLLWVLESALDGGIKAVQLREKDLEGGDLFRLAERARALCQRYDADLFVNDRVDIALAVDAAGVQLGQASIPVEAARALLGAGRTIGWSAHSLDEAAAAVRSGADFIVFGPVYFTPSKAAYGAPQGISKLKKIVENIAVPVYAIGGIKNESVCEIMSLGARGVALISAIAGAEDPKAAAAQLLKALER